MSQITDLDEHKRRLFLENLSPKTTRQSLEDYLSAFEIVKCSVLCTGSGQNKSHAIVTFAKEASITSLMSKRPLSIDEQEVEIYRSIPDQGSLKNNKGVKILIVTGITNGSLTKSDLEQCFQAYGKITKIGEINNQENSCLIEFNDYDSVDKALLDVPHTVKRISVSIKKVSRNFQRELSATRNPAPTTTHRNISTIPKKSNMKQITINSQVSYVSLPKSALCIHVTNLPSNADAESLSKRFQWSIFDILIRASLNDQLSRIECWLKNADDEQTIDDFIRRWNEKTIDGSKIECEKEEDELELCRFFRTRQCEQSDEKCNWTHVKCTANGTCATDCPYGHKQGMKAENLTTKKVITTYRIKISGFRTNLTPRSLSQQLQQDEKLCYVDRKQDHIGYIVKLQSTKYAKYLMKKWHNKNIADDQILKCQLELNSKSSNLGALSRSQLSLNNDEIENHSHRRRDSRQRYDSSSQSSRESSISRDGDHSTITVVDDRHINCDGRLYAQAFKDLGQTRAKNILCNVSSTESMASSVESKLHLPSDLPSGVWEITKKAPGKGGKVLLIRGQTDRKRLAVIKIYTNDLNGDSYRELNALQILKGKCNDCKNRHLKNARVFHFSFDFVAGVENVVRLIEPENASNNIDQQAAGKADFWIIMERAPGYSLKEFLDRKYRGDIGVLEATQLAQSLIQIVKHVHSRDIVHQNIEPENVMIEWDPKKTSIDQARLTLLNFAQAYNNKTGKTDPVAQPIAPKWYHSAQANMQSLSYSPTTDDASGICAIFFWLLTKVDPRHDENALPHQQREARDEIDRKIARAIKTANTTRKPPLEIKQLKTYLIDTFNRGFGFPEYQPWTIGDLECRLESIRELLSPRDSKLVTAEDVFKHLLSISASTTSSAPSMTTTHVYQDEFQKARDVFCQAKQHLSICSPSQYSWLDGNCTWLDTAQNSMNECRHDDVLTFYWFGRHCSAIITCLASVSDQGQVITLSIASIVNGKMIRIPLGQFSTTQDYKIELQDNFTTELKNLLISIYKERQATQQ